MPILTIPAAQTLKSTQSRIVPTETLKSAGWSFVCETNGVFMTYSAVKTAEDDKKAGTVFYLY